MAPSFPVKRRVRQEELGPPPPQEGKRRRLADSDAGEEQREVGATELASAFALASLASSNPRRKRVGLSTQTIDQDHGEENSTASFEARSPQDEPVPISPDVRSPIRPVGNKRVTFAPDIKVAPRTTARTYSFPPKYSHGPQVSRMPAGFARAPVVPRPHMHPPWMRHHVFPRRPNFMSQPIAAPPSSGQWVCDFCNMASFSTYQEACLHEEGCRVRFGMVQTPQHPPMWYHHFGGHANPQSLRPTPTPAHPPPGGPYSRKAEPVTSGPPPTGGVEGSPRVLASSGKRWFEGTMSLAVAESDQEWLSALNCFIREECVEAFSATAADAGKTSKRGRITLAQVGIRCCYCKHHPSEAREPGAVSYPVSVSGIYESVKRWQKVHLELCKDVPVHVREKIGELTTENAWVPTTRQYWADSAKARGLADTDEGIRFASDPKSSIVSFTATDHNIETDSRDEKTLKSPERGGALVDGEYIVFPEDTALVPPYVYFLMRQVEGCHFTEADRFVARSKGPVGFPGFQCRHCNGHAGLGKYFPVSSKSLSTNSTSQNIHSHLLKCRKCPQHVKDQLLSLKEEKSKAPRLEPGWRKIFFDKVWGRLHG